jgi:hypothetical protein
MNPTQKLAIACALAGAVAISVGSQARADATECNANFTTSGSFFSGKTYRTWAVLPSVTPLDAFKRVYTHVVKEGYRINQADRELGMISASQDVSGGEGKSVPLNVIVEAGEGTGSKITVTFSLSGGLISSHVQETLCAVIGSAEGG